MTEELKKEAEDYAREWLYHVKDLELHHKEDDKPEYIRIKEAYLAGAEPREKRIADLEDKLANADYQLEGRDLEIKELKAQVEKMKCCENCRYCNEWGEANSNSPNCKKCNWVSNWKLRR